MAHDSPSLSALRIERPAGPPPRARWPWVVGAALAAALAVLAFLRFGRPAAIVVETAVAREVVAGGTGRTLLDASGYVTARRTATVSSKVTGRVVEVLIEEGVKVDEGQLLARLDDTSARAGLRLAEARLEAARRAVGETEAGLAQARRSLERARNLAAGKVVSESDLDEAASAVAVLEARMERQRAEIAAAERERDLGAQQVDDNLIRAPFAGVVTSKNAQPGEMISPISAGGGFTRTGICTIVDMASLEVEVDVNESYINRVSPGQPVLVTLDSYPDWRIPSKVIAIIPTADRQKATVRVRVGFESLDPRILPDMGLKVAFQSTEPGAAGARVVVVPRQAVRRTGGVDIVWVLRDGRVERRAVSTAAMAGADAAITAGLAAGETVVVGGPDTLADGARVAAKPL
jgi:RND family efflux transporter MFP subunit